MTEKAKESMDMTQEVPTEFVPEPTLETTLRAQIIEVALLRSIAWSNKEILRIDREKWETEKQEQIMAVKSTQCDVELAEIKLRELTLKAYAETGNKSPAAGVGIREITILNYDSKIAFDWAKAHKMALKLDTEAFKKIAKADPPDFVKITTEPQATIATDLSKVLEDYCLGWF